MFLYIIIKRGKKQVSGKKTKAINDYGASLEYDLMKYKLTSEALGIALWDMDVVEGDPVNPNNKFTWSHEFRQMLGFSDEADFPNILSSWSGRLHPEDQKRTLDAFEAHMTDRTGKIPYDLEYRLMLKNGEYRHFRAFGTTMRDSNGTPLRVAGALQDIHDKKMQNELIAKANEQNELQLTQISMVVKAAKIGLWDMWIVEGDPVNPTNTFTWSDDFRHLLGFTNEDDFPNVTSSWENQIHPDDRSLVMDSFEKHILDKSGATPYDLEYRMFMKNGECIYVRDFGNTIRDENGNAIRVAGALEDITERRLMQETLKKALEESNKARDFTTNILNKSDAMIYVTDLETDELLFITDYMKQQFGIEGDVTGQPCYKVLQKGMNERCDFCPCRQLDKEPDKVVVWEERNTLTNCYYLNTDRYIDWPGGKKVHIQFVVDLTEIKEVQEKLEQREKKLEALNKMAAILLSQENESFDETMGRGLKPITEAAGVDRIAIYKLLDKESAQLGQVYLWYGKTIPLEDELIMLPQNPPVIRWTEQLLNGISINENVSKLPEDAAEFLSLFGVKAIYFVPIFIKGEFWGVVTLEDHTDYRYFDDDILNLMQSAAHLCANTFIRAEMEREIAIVEERTKLMLDSSPIGCNIWDQNLNLIDCNEAIVSLFGLKSKQEYLKRFFEYSPEYQPDGKHSSNEAENHVRRAFAKDGSITFEWMHRKADGTPLPTEITLVRVNYGNGYVVAGYTRDLRAEKQMVEHAQMLLNATPLCCQLWDRNYRMIDCNDEAVKLFGMKDKQEFLEDFFKFSPEYQLNGRRTDELVVELLDEAFAKGRGTFSWVYRMLDGALMPAEGVLTRIKYKDDYAVAVYTRDMREHNRMMEDIEYRDNLLLALNQAAFFLFDSDLKSFENDLYRSMGIIAEAIKADRVYIGKNNMVGGRLCYTQLYEWTEGAEPQQGNMFTADFPYGDISTEWEELLSKGLCVNSLLRDMSTKEQAIFSPQGILSIIVAPIFIKNKFWGIVGFDDCHSERIFMKEEESILRSSGLLFVNALLRNEMMQNILDTSVQLESALKEANASSKAKGDFLSNMSHEMRTPMNAIIGMTVIGKNAKDIDQKNHALNKIGDASSHLLGVINDVLDMAKIEADKLELSSVEYNFEKMLQKVVTVISFRVDEKRQRLTVNIDDGIPRFLIGDDQRLAQVVTNLLSNAVKFTPEEGSIRLEAFFAGEQNGICEVRIEVTDSGIGISPEQHNKIFQAFEQAESGTSRNYGGTGLGLVISKRIVELMDGNIRLESELGKGAKFIFTVKAGRGKKSPCSLLAPGVNWENIRIIVIDDMIETRNQFEDIFSQLGIRCDVAADGQEALNIIEERGEYDIYFIDWRMPVMDGIELT
ncbi:MAG: PAS domain-containing protein, partial [Treponema sp.]|nr:PAS domain-containing protein [Treponema sp.]